MFRSAVASSLALSCYVLPLTSATFGGALQVRADEPMHCENYLSDVNLPGDEFGATVFALLYGYPLSAYSSVFHGSIGLSALGTNKFFSLGNVAKPGDNTVVRPNVDTIYGISILDVSQEDVVLTVPPMQSDRFYLFSFYDPYGDNYASLGSLHHSKPGEYLIRPSLNTGNAGNSTRDCRGYSGCVNAPTLDGLLLVRVELKNNQSDLHTVNKYLGKVKTKGAKKHKPTAPPFMPKDLKGLSKDRTHRALQLTARLAGRNPPQSPDLATLLPWVLRSAGLYGGEYHHSSKVNLTNVTSRWDKILRKFHASRQNNVALNNGWSYLSPSFSGSFEGGRNIVARSFVARFAYLQNTADQAIYPTPARQTYSLSKGEAYVLTFSGKPPVERAGFWSLTIYNDKGFLIANAQHVYSLGDRSNLTYPNGDRVYGSTNNGEDKPFQMLIQSTQTPPPKNWTNNWLPSPPNGEAFELTLRLFGPKPSARDGTYKYPIFTKGKALRQ